MINEVVQEEFVKNCLKTTPSERLQMLADINGRIRMACKNDYEKSERILEYLDGKKVIALGKRNYAIILNEGGPEPSIQ